MRISLKKTLNINLTLEEVCRIRNLLNIQLENDHECLWVRLGVNKNPITGSPIYSFTFYRYKTVGCYMVLESGKSSFAVSWKRDHKEIRRNNFCELPEWSTKGVPVMAGLHTGVNPRVEIAICTGSGFISSTHRDQLLRASTKQEPLKRHTPEQKDMWEPSPYSIRADPAAFSVADPVRISQAGKAQNFDPERHFQQRYPLKANKSKSTMDTCSITIVVDGHTICAREVPKLLALKFAAKLEQVYK